MIRRVCQSCRRLTEHKTVKLGEGMRQREWQECQGCWHMSPRPRRRSDWAGV